MSANTHACTDAGVPQKALNDSEAKEGRHPASMLLTPNGMSLHFVVPSEVQQSLGRRQRLLQTGKENKKVYTGQKAACIKERFPNWQASKGLTKCVQPLVIFTGKQHL
eukprot:1160575-Pelagomonas_calceolata.AAC.4